jgi:hypothetical protein
MTLPGKILWKLFGKPEEKEFRRKLPIFIICLIIATFIWGLIKLSNVYEETIQVKIQFVNQPTDQVVAHKADTTVYTLVKAEGFQMLFWHWKIYNSRLRIDLTKLPLPKSRDKNGHQVQVPAIQVIKTMAMESRLPGIITKVYPENFDFFVSQRISKKVPVVPLLDIDFASQHKLYNPPKCEPDSVIISGSKADLQTINSVSTTLLRHHRLKADVSSVLQIENLWTHKGVLISHKDAKVFLDVENYTEASVDLAVKVDTKGTDDNIKTFPETVKVVYQVAIKDFKRISADDFEVRVVYDPNQAHDAKLNVILSKRPDKVFVSRIIPENLEYVLIQ